MMRHRRCACVAMAVVCIGIVALAAFPAFAQTPSPEAAFPEYQVPGHEAEMATLRALHRHHFGSRTRTTLWDPWLPWASLWPAVGDGPDNAAPSARDMRDYYRDSLLTRGIDPEGYVATQQHRGLAHAQGWPFPTWAQARGVGWHFSLAHDPYAAMLGHVPTTSLDGWQLDGLELLRIDPNLGAVFRLTRPRAALTTPAFRVEPIASPFVTVEWTTLDSGNKGDGSVQASLAWTTVDGPEFGADRRAELPGRRTARQLLDTHMVRLDQTPGFFDSPLTRFRLEFDGPAGAECVVLDLHTAIDTRHPINNAVYLMACADYFDATTDVAFLQSNIGRMRQALAFALREFSVRQHHLVVVPWTGHDGRSGLVFDESQQKTIRYGHGVGNNYWDLLPFGHRDAYATLYLFAALRQMAGLERAIAAHAGQWTIAAPPEDQSAAALDGLAVSLRDEARRTFWNPATGRFIGWIDADGQPAPDVGLTALNQEAVYYGLASPEQARSILDWIDGRRTVEGDTSTGDDIYHWTFAPRCTTRRNTTTYVWCWSQPEDIPWGHQIQDGGAVLGWSYFDLMARLDVFGPNDAWNRLETILHWFEQVQAEGGYRAYYAPDKNRGALQGGNVPGGLGLDQEFFESVLVPQVMTRGFLGLTPRPGGLALNPRLPDDWPSLTVTRYAIQDRVLDITAHHDGSIQLHSTAGTGPLQLELPAGSWAVQTAGHPPRSQTLDTSTPTLSLDFAAGDDVLIRPAP